MDNHVRNAPLVGRQPVELFVGLFGPTMDFGLPSAIDHQVRIQAAKSLRNVAVETHRQVGRQDIGQQLRRNLVALNREALRILQRRSVFQPVDLPDGLAAVDALLVPVPIRQDIANQTFFGRELDLPQTVLATILKLRPARAGFQL